MRSCINCRSGRTPGYCFLKTSVVIPRPRFHASPPQGWMNDPNGLCWFKGEYHLFYQHNPKAPRWGRMYWGHATSPDLISWTHHETALKPDGRWDSLLGCFSGTALVHEDALHLFYTGVSVRGQYQLHAVSEDGRHFRKTRHPVIPPGKLPPGHGALHFRDPKVFRRQTSQGDLFYALIGGRARNGASRISLYRSPNLQDWNYVSAVLEDRLPKGGIFECPDFAVLSGRDVLFASPQFLPRSSENEFRNLHSAFYLPGKLDCDKGSFIPDVRAYREIDSGADYYAPQTLETPDGRIVQIAWMDMWKRSRPSAESGWTGCMTIPRELRFERGRLLQNPVKELEKYRGTRHSVPRQVLRGTIPMKESASTGMDLNLSVDVSRSMVFGLRLMLSPDGRHFMDIHYKTDSGILSCDRSRIRHRIESRSTLEAECDIRSAGVDIPDGILKLRILVDAGCVEVFAGEGETAMSMLAFHGSQDSGMEFYCKGEAEILGCEAYELDGPS